MLQTRFFSIRFVLFSLSLSVSLSLSLSLSLCLSLAVDLEPLECQVVRFVTHLGVL